MVFRGIGGAEGFGGAFAHGGEKFQVVDGVQDGGVFGKALGDLQHEVFRFHEGALCKKLAKGFSCACVRRGFNAKAQRRRDAKDANGRRLTPAISRRVES